MTDPIPARRLGVDDALQPIAVRLCDDSGLVSDEPIAPGYPYHQFGLTYRQLLNNGRAANSDPDKRAPYTGDPFRCTGGAHMAGAVFRCTSPAHMRTALPQSAAIGGQPVLTATTPPNGTGPKRR